MFWKQYGSRRDKMYFTSFHQLLRVPSSEIIKIVYNLNYINFQKIYFNGVQNSCSTYMSHDKITHKQ